MYACIIDFQHRSHAIGSVCIFFNPGLLTCLTKRNLEVITEIACGFASFTTQLTTGGTLVNQAQIRFVPVRAALLLILRVLAFLWVCKKMPRHIGHMTINVNQRPRCLLKLQLILHFFGSLSWQRVFSPCDSPLHGL
jgi:hypothetical protein